MLKLLFIPLVIFVFHCELVHASSSVRIPSYLTEGIPFFSDKYSEEGAPLQRGCLVKDQPEIYQKVTALNEHARKIALNIETLSAALSEIEEGSGSAIKELMNKTGCEIKAQFFTKNIIKDLYLIEEDKDKLIIKTEGSVSSVLYFINNQLTVIDHIFSFLQNLTDKSALSYIQNQITDFTLVNCLSQELQNQQEKAFHKIQTCLEQLPGLLDETETQGIEIYNTCFDYLKPKFIKDDSMEIFLYEAFDIDYISIFIKSLIDEEDFIANALYRSLQNVLRCIRKDKINDPVEIKLEFINISVPEVYMLDPSGGEKPHYRNRCPALKDKTIVCRQGHKRSRIRKEKKLYQKKCIQDKIRYDNSINRQKEFFELASLISETIQLYFDEKKLGTIELGFLNEVIMFEDGKK